MSTRLILVRHGETEANVAQIWHGSEDAPLTARGRRQVAATAERMARLAAERRVDACYVSPLPRAQSTARAIADAIGCEPQIEVGLREFGLGDWEGRSFVELRDQEQLWLRWQRDPDFAPPNGESPRSFAARIVEAVDDLAARHPDKTLLAVTHGGVISNLLAEWLGEGLGDWRQWEPHNCAVTILESAPSGGWMALVVNDVTHLPADAIVAEDKSVYDLPDDVLDAAAEG